MNCCGNRDLVDVCAYAFDTISDVLEIFHHAGSDGVDLERSPCLTRAPLFALVR